MVKRRCAGRPRSAPRTKTATEARCWPLITSTAAQTTGKNTAESNMAGCQ